MLEAARLQWGFDRDVLIDRLQSLVDESPTVQNLFLSQWKGKYFEVILRDRFNAGESIEGIQLTPGQVARLFESPTHPGSDLEIINGDGTIAEELQAKATHLVSYARRALDKYPDIRVISTDEVAQADQMADGMLLNSGVKDAELEEKIRTPLEGVIDDVPFKNFMEDVLPGLPFVLIATTEGARVLMGRQTLQEALNRSFERGLKSGAAMSVGALAAFAGAGIISLPATFATRLGISRFQVYKGLNRRLEADINAVRQLQNG